MAIIQNAVYLTKENKFLMSKHVHDFVSFVVDGQQCSIDGGNEYLKRSGSFENMPGIAEWSLDDSDPFEEIAAKLLWGTRGKDGKDPFRWVPLSECTTEHLRAILNTQILRSDDAATILRKLGVKEVSETPEEDLMLVERIKGRIPRVDPIAERVIRHHLGNSEANTS